MLGARAWPSAPVGNGGAEIDASSWDSEDGEVGRFTRRLARRQEARDRVIPDLRKDIGKGKLRDPLEPSFQLLARSLVQETETRFSELVRRLIDRSMLSLDAPPCPAITSGECHGLLARALVANHVGSLAREALSVGRLGHAAVLTRIVAEDRHASRSAEVNKHVLELAHNLARELLDRRAAPPLCSVLGSIGAMAIGAALLDGGFREHRFDEACRSLAELGQRIPRAFHPQGEPEITIVPSALGLESRLPLAALLDATWKIKEGVFTSPSAATVSPLIWADAVKVTAREIAAYSVSVLKDDRLEGSLLSAIEQLADVGINGARQGDDKWAMFASLALAELAPGANQPIWREYPDYLAIRLAEIAIWALDRKITVHGLGDELLGQRLARTIARDLPSAVPYVREQVEHMRFDAASLEANETFLREFAD